MDYLSALDIVVARTRHERYRWLCSDDNPNIAQRNSYREFVIREANGGTSVYPPLREQLGNAASAVGRVAYAMMHGQHIAVDQDEQNRRLAICRDCEFFDATQGRCMKCGCFGAFKSWLATERCPIGKW